MLSASRIRPGAIDMSIYSNSLYNRKSPGKFLGLSRDSHGTTKSSIQREGGSETGRRSLLGSVHSNGRASVRSGYSITS